MIRSSVIELLAGASIAPRRERELANEAWLYRGMELKRFTWEAERKRVATRRARGSR